MIPTFLIQKRTALQAIAAVALVSGASGQAGAVSMRVKMACANDYYSHCSAHAIDSQALRQCMRQHGPQLSKTCISALIAAGEVSQAEVERRRQELQRAAAMN